MDDQLSVLAGDLKGPPDGARGGYEAEVGVLPCSPVRGKQHLQSRGIEEPDEGQVHDQPSWPVTQGRFDRMTQHRRGVEVHFAVDDEHHCPAETLNRHGQGRRPANRGFTAPGRKLHDRADHAGPCSALAAAIAHGSRVERIGRRPRTATTKVEGYEFHDRGSRHCGQSTVDRREGGVWALRRCRLAFYRDGGARIVFPDRLLGFEPPGPRRRTVGGIPPSGGRERESSMFTITESAAEAINQLTTAQNVQAQGGLRMTLNGLPEDGAALAAENHR